MITVNEIPELLPTEVVEAAGQLSTSLLADSLMGFGAMDYRIKPIVTGSKVAGTAFTVDVKAGGAPAVIAAVALIKKGYVMVVSGKGNTLNAILGDLLMKTAIKSGISGVVLDGLVRDIAELRELGVPVFALGAVAAAPDKEGAGEINGAISCGGVAVRPGDLIVGDDDGVVVIPRAKVHEAIAAAQAKEASEVSRIQAIENGLLLPDWLKKQLVYVEKQ